MFKLAPKEGIIYLIHAVDCDKPWDELVIKQYLDNRLGARQALKQVKMLNKLLYSNPTTADLRSHPTHGALLDSAVNVVNRALANAYIATNQDNQDKGRQK